MYAAIILGSAILALRIQDAAVMTMKEEKETVTETGIETEKEKEKEKENARGWRRSFGAEAYPAEQENAAR